MSTAPQALLSEGEKPFAADFESSRIRTDGLSKLQEHKTVFLNNVKAIFGQDLTKLDSSGLKTAIKSIPGYDVRRPDMHFHKKIKLNGDEGILAPLPNSKSYAQIMVKDVIAELAKASHYAQ